MQTTASQVGTVGYPAGQTPAPLDRRGPSEALHLCVGVGGPIGSDETVNAAGDSTTPIPVILVDGFKGGPRRRLTSGADVPKTSVELLVDVAHLRCAHPM